GDSEEAVRALLALGLQRCQPGSERRAELERLQATVDTYAFIAHCEGWQAWQDSVIGEVAAPDEWQISLTEMRSLEWVDVAKSLAQRGRIKAVTILFMNCPGATFPNRLTLLNELPETIDPRNYSHLLPW
ncbi:unnamed protein product, partial [Chrysoparadoxa australica]